MHKTTTSQFYNFLAKKRSTSHFQINRSFAQGLNMKQYKTWCSWLVDKNIKLKIILNQQRTLSFTPSSFAYTYLYSWNSLKEMCWQSDCFELCSFCCGSPRQFPRNQSAVKVDRLSSLAGWVETVNSQSRRTSSVGHAWLTNDLVTTRDNYLVHSQLRLTNNPITQTC